MKTIPLKKAWLGEADCRNCSVRGSVLFSGLEETDFEHIHQPIDNLVCPGGGLLYRAGERGRALFTLRRGALKLVQYLPDGSQRIVRVLKATDVAGLEALLDQPYQHDAIALTSLEVCRLPVDVVKRIARDQPRLHQEIMLRWQRALNEADAWLTQFSTGTARQRVARLLLRLADPHDEHGLRLFAREDIGAMLGITTETASRVIAEFKRQGHLSELGQSGLLRIERESLHAIADT